MLAATEPTRGCRGVSCNRQSLSCAQDVMKLGKRTTFLKSCRLANQTSGTHARENMGIWFFPARSSQVEERSMWACCQRHATRVETRPFLSLGCQPLEYGSVFKGRAASGKLGRHVHYVSSRPLGGNWESGGREFRGEGGRRIVLIFVGGVLEASGGRVWSGSMSWKADE